jgi:hypothetical protein
VKKTSRAKTHKYRKQAADLSNALSSVPHLITDSWLQAQLTVTPAEIDAFERGLVNDFAEVNFNDLLANCRKNIIDSIIKPLGLGKFVALYDRLGGNVDTIHNVRLTDEDGQPIATEKTKQKLN